MRKQIPAFKTEEEEARWWDKHRVEHEDTMLEDLQESKAITLDQALEQAKSGATPNITIRIDREDVELAKQQARAKGLRYQTYLKMLIHEALHKRRAS